MRLPWVTRIHAMLNGCGFAHIWNDQLVISDWLKPALKLRLNDQYQQSWNAEVLQSNNCINHRMYILPAQLRFKLCRFRLSYHNLTIEKSGHDSVVPCNSSDIGDEFHYLFICSYLYRETKLYLPR